MSDALFEPLKDQSKPQHFWAHETEQYRLKIRPFSRLPAEFTVQKISFERDFEAVHRAYENGQTSCLTLRGKRQKGAALPDAESIERSQRRAKTQVRLLATELAPSALITFTTRAILTVNQLLQVWQYFTRSMRVSGLDFDYVAVPERHPTNPDHLHIHAAYRGKAHIKAMRRLWHIALESIHGRRVTKTLYGKESPGNIDVQSLRAGSQIKRCRKIAKYISKYITKDLIAEFNRRRYWPSKGITLAEARTYWLDSLTQVDAIREACRMLGQWDELIGATTQRLFCPSDRVAWCSIDPDATPPPPF